MTPKRRPIRISDDAYAALLKLKRPDESVEELILRLADRGDLSRFVGSISPGFAAELRLSATAFRSKMDDEYRQRSR